MKLTKNKRASRRSQSTRIVNEVNQLIQSEQLQLSTLHVLHSRLKVVKTELGALNAELETFMTDEQVAEDYDSVVEYEDAATSCLALLKHHLDIITWTWTAPHGQHHIDMTSTAHSPATADGDPGDFAKQHDATSTQLSSKQQILWSQQELLLSHNSHKGSPTTKLGYHKRSFHQEEALFHSEKVAEQDAL
ncbi:hypothetical protein HPB52_016274 [Rhipicephalus sanguineus]|uniref:Uncharacterized protein n=1 Tax=Rhipicephalus sanguineus TaxID=34632 RepID=A0A9D4PS11_RHISA|nr:hypothetical protein HPB52_016274 [Rhipicephalus sanguineus]